MASLVLGSVPKDSRGVASGTNAAFRELGGVFGIAISARSSRRAAATSQPQDYVNGLRPAMYVGAGAVVIGFACALLVSGRRAHKTKEASWEPRRGTAEHLAIELSPTLDYYAVVKP